MTFRTPKLNALTGWIAIKSACGPPRGFHIPSLLGKVLLPFEFLSGVSLLVVLIYLTNHSQLLDLLLIIGSHTQVGRQKLAYYSFLTQNLRVWSLLSSKVCRSFVIPHHTAHGWPGFFSVLEATGDDQIRTQGSLPNTVARITLVFVLTLSGQAIPGLLPLIGVFSSVFCVCNNMFFPILFYSRLRWKAAQPASALDRALDAAQIE